MAPDNAGYDIAMIPDGFVPSSTADAKVATSSSCELREYLRINDMRYDEIISYR